ncbi:transposase [Okeania sp. SIO1F9]|uniref:transposase n=1 Tax=Okeania sp. SIO1F9 TaxID=2607813 RepID=UPI00339052F1
MVSINHGVAVNVYLRAIQEKLCPIVAGHYIEDRILKGIGAACRVFAHWCNEAIALGIDLGRTDIASTSEGESWSGKNITSKRNHYSQIRAVLQKKASKGTRSSRKRCRQLQQRLSGKERRFQKHVNHEITTYLVRKAATIDILPTLHLRDSAGFPNITDGGFLLQCTRLRGFTPFRSYSRSTD